MKNPIILLIFILLPISSVKSFSFLDQKEDVTIYIFLSETCPICQSITQDLIQIDKRFQIEGAKLIGVFPSPSLSTEESRKIFAAKYKLTFPLLSDSDHTITNKYQAKITPEVVVVNERSGDIIYRGLIDNSFVSVGKRRRVVSEHYLMDALKQFYSGNSSSITQTQPVGCKIQF